MWLFKFSMAWLVHNGARNSYMQQLMAQKTWLANIKVWWQGLSMFVFKAFIAFGVQLTNWTLRSTISCQRFSRLVLEILSLRSLDIYGVKQIYEQRWDRHVLLSVRQDDIQWVVLLLGYWTTATGLNNTWMRNIQQLHQNSCGGFFLQSSSVSWTLLTYVSSPSRGRTH